MIRLLACCLMLLSLASGCAMCSHCDDYTYSATGGKNPRMNMAHGRVHSAYDPADGVVEGAVVSESQPAEKVPMPMQEESDPPTTTYRGRWNR